MSVNFIKIGPMVTEIEQKISEDFPEWKLLKLELTIAASIFHLKTRLTCQIIS